MRGFLQPINEEMIRMLELKPTDHVLDVATGTGEPGLTIATLVSEGNVTGTDLSENMLAVAKEHAQVRGIKNFETVCSDVTHMPFDDETFDAITCRLSFMFFPDMNLALNEMMRVLKPGGRICAAVWNGPEKNFWICNSMEVMIRRLNLNRPAPGSPGIYRCAEPGMMSALFSGAGLHAVTETIVDGTLKCETFENYWNFISEAGSPAAFSTADDDLKLEIKEEVHAKLLERFTDENISLPSSATVVCGQKK